MKIKQYQVDAFTTRRFEGNPAAVCLLDNWLDDRLLQAIAEENNLSETAFLVRQASDFALRWFTPLTEVALCGHATLASAHVLFEILGHPEKQIRFATLSGQLSVEKSENGLTMNFPAQIPQPVALPEALAEALGQVPLEVLAGDDYVAVFASESCIRQIEPDHTLLGRLDRRSVIITAPGQNVDFVSRFFAPKQGIPEDPVTGSAHCQLAPYWAEKLGKTHLQARQLSRRGGEIACTLQGDRVLLSGHAVTFMEGEITI